MESGEAGERLAPESPFLPVPRRAAPAPFASAPARGGPSERRRVGTSEESSAAPHAGHDGLPAEISSEHSGHFNIGRGLYHLSNLRRPAREKSSTKPHESRLKEASGLSLLFFVSFRAASWTIFFCPAIS
jgi:hypothetical protein